MKIEFIPVLEEALAYPPEPLKKNLPDWYKNMSSYTEAGGMNAKDLNATNAQTHLTGKRCVPLMDFMTSGYIIKTNTEIMVSAGEDGHFGDFHWRSIGQTEKKFGTHPHIQLPILLDGKRRNYFKIFSGHMIRTPPGYSCLFYQNPYFRDDRFKLFPAIVDTDVYDSPIAFSGYWTDQMTEQTIAVGTPVAVVFPFKRDDWKMEVSKRIRDNDKESSFIMRMKTAFTNIYRNFFHQKKSYT